MNSMLSSSEGVDSDAFNLMVEVMQGNPGAGEIICHLLALPIWYQLLHHCKAQGLVGSTLWRVVKDDFGHDWQRFVADQLSQMAPERAHALRRLGRDMSSHQN